MANMDILYVHFISIGGIMKVAIIGSRNISMSIDELTEYIPEGTTEIVSGGARGVDTVAREFAIYNNIKLTEFLPDYQRYKRGAPLIRNREIINYADTVIAFWDGNSRGTKFVIDECKKAGKTVQVIIIESN